MDADGNDEIIKIVKKFLRAAIETGVRIDRAFLFGSRARGDMREDSDIDVAVISEEFSGNRILDSDPLDGLVWDIDVRIEPVTFRPENFNDDDPLACHVLKEGIEIQIPETRQG